MRHIAITRIGERNEANETKAMANTTQRKGFDVRKACIDEAIRIMEADGITAVNLREVARRVGISKQAPYKHFDSRDHLIAEIVTIAFESFADHLRIEDENAKPADALEYMIRAYFEFSQKHPAFLQLMFNTQLPDRDEHPEMMKNSKDAFYMLHDAVAGLPETVSDANPELRTDVGALFVWSAIHGFSTLRNSQAWGRLGFSDQALDTAIRMIAQQIRTGLKVRKFSAGGSD